MDDVMVFTSKGLVERSRLVAKDIVFEEANARLIATEWFIRGREAEGHVRRDVWCNVLRPIAAQAA